MSAKQIRVIGYVLLFVGLLFTAFFLKYHGNVIQHPFVWKFFGNFLFFLGLGLIAFAAKKKNFTKKINPDQLETLLKTGEKISVDLLNCKVISTNSIKERSDQDDMVLLLAGRKMSYLTETADNGPPIGSTLYQSVFIFEREKDGKKQKFISPVISKEPTTLEFLIAGQKTTTLYIDKENPENYWFDLQFLKD